MKQKKIESKLTKAKKRLGKITAKVSSLESRLEKGKKGAGDREQTKTKPVPSLKSEANT